MRVVKPAAVSIEDALRNLVCRLTGRPSNELPRTQEGLVQFLAETLPGVEELAEAVTQEVVARLTASPGQDGETPEPSGEGAKSKKKAAKAAE